MFGIPRSPPVEETQFASVARDAERTPRHHLPGHNHGTVNGHSHEDGPTPTGKRHRGTVERGKGRFRFGLTGKRSGEIAPVSDRGRRTAQKTSFSVHRVVLTEDSAARSHVCCKVKRQSAGPGLQGKTHLNGP